MRVDRKKSSLTLFFLSLSLDFSPILKNNNRCLGMQVVALLLNNLHR